MILFLLSLLHPTPFISTDSFFQAVQPQPVQAPVQPKPQPTPPKTVKISALAAVIGKAESDTAGGYNAANAGRAMDLGTNGLIRLTGKPCNQVTLGELKQWQRRGLLYAVGRYQMIPGTLRQAAKWAGLKDSDTFSPVNQDKMLEAILKHKRPKVWAYLTNNATLNQAIDSLSKEWSGLPCTRGIGYYGHSNVSLAALKSALVEAKAW